MVRTIYFVLLLFLCSCAQLRPPEGGPVDLEPPVALYYYPEILSTHFSQNEFTIVFDEYIQLKSLQSQLVISPPLKEKPTAHLKGKELTISWTDTLLENTTYLFNFGSAIVDFNEGNIANDLIYVFSTGDFIDSLNYTGTVWDAYTNKPAEGMAVMLYSGEQDSLPFSVKPNYVAFTDSAGNFELSYLKEGTYKLFALQDQNGNYLFDSPAEPIAFDTNRISAAVADSTLTQPKYFSFLNADSIQFIREISSTDYGKVTILFNLPVEEPHLKFIVSEGANSGEKLPYTLYGNETGDSLIAWVRNLTDAESINIIASAGSPEPDTSFWFREVNPKYSDKPQLDLSQNISKGKLDLQKLPLFTVENPIDTIYKNSIILKEDSTEVNFSLVFPDSLRRTFEINYPFQEKKAYTLILNDSSIVDIYGAANDSLKLMFQLQDQLYYGRLLVNLNLDSTQSPQLIVQLWQDTKLIREDTVTASQQVQYTNLAPGNYSVKAIFDDDKNGHWTTGDYKTKRQPEKVDWLPQQISIRSNWDLEQDWTPIDPDYQ